MSQHEQSTQQRQPSAGENRSTITFKRRAGFGRGLGRARAPSAVHGSAEADGFHARGVGTTPTGSRATRGRRNGGGHHSSGLAPAGPHRAGGRSESPCRVNGCFGTDGTSWPNGGASRCGGDPSGATCVPHPGDGGRGIGRSQSDHRWEYVGRPYAGHRHICNASGRRRVSGCMTRGRQCSPRQEWCRRQCPRHQR